MMMALINIGAMLDYRRPTALLRRVAGFENIGTGASVTPTHPTCVTATTIKVLMTKPLDVDSSKTDVDNEDFDVDTAACALWRDQCSQSISHEPELPAAVKLDMHLTFSMLAHTLRHRF